MSTNKRFHVAGTAVVLCLAIAGAYSAAAVKAFGPAAGEAGRRPVPASIAAEHRELHAALAQAIGAGGQTAVEARKVERLLQPHFVKEERFALAPLAALPDVAAGRVPSNAAEIVGMSAHLQDEMPAMLAEHRAIAEALERLRQAAEKERKHEASAFAARLKAHAQQEEEIHYPSAVLVGKYLAMKRH